MTARAWVTATVGASLCFAVAHCGGGDDSSGAQSQNDAGGDAIATGDAGPSDSGPAGPHVDVDGTLVGRASDDGALAGRDVIVIDANEIVTKTSSGADGKFHVAGVATPYDIAVPYVPLDAAAGAYPQYYAGITRPDPVVHGIDYLTVDPPVLHQATINFTANVCNNCTLFFSGGKTTPNQKFTGTGASAAYAGTYYWTGADSTTATLHYLVYDTNGNYTTFADQMVSVTSAGTVNAGASTFSAVAGEGVCDFVATAPAGYTVGGVKMQAFHSDGSELAVLSNATGDLGVEFPKFAGGSVVVSTNAAGPSGESATGFSSYDTSADIDAHIDMAVPPSPLTPTDHSTGVTDSQALTWSAFATPTMYVVSLVSPQGSLLIRSSSTTFDLGRLIKAGMGLAPATSYTYAISTGSPYPSIDDYVVSVPAISNGPVVIYAYSKPLTFTTQ